MSKLRGLVMFAALGFGALAGCGGVADDGQVSELASVEQGVRYCEYTNQCPSGQVCINSGCQTVPEGSFPCERWDFGPEAASSLVYCKPTQICCLTTGTCVSNASQCQPWP
ncbi:hypothetical protein HPP05_05490 [Corallococcus exiguus]|uniref:hypothetical protein n=1 Tax=Corallococcus TaxID=83461 RepID=UPI0011C3A41C|nr:MULTISPECIES: hypothetical protein [Corallococcus]NPC69200.1 hypothetical protein [Corallococcus exiguus]NRD43044.1 hypothetical protein [Corallococcus exiguus]